ncbi:hypothetical protein QQF64_018553 [Cirrhinus molitorella]|uniref:Integrase catalytic domain-containing protein n=1 Tax=Cirrhinus molitorella TaxID=172907 RepID=A0ABR3LCX2_9TELE
MDAATQLKKMEIEVRCGEKEIMEEELKDRSGSRRRRDATLSIRDIKALIQEENLNPDHVISKRAKRKFRLKNFLLKGETPETSTDRRKVRRSSTDFIIKDDRLFYVGPSRQYMRLVVLSEEEKRSVLTECHNNPGTGNHSGVRGTQNRVIAGYYWPTVIRDVKEWVRSCHRCQLNDPIKTVVPVLHSIKVKEPWEVLGLDLIGPLPETARKNKYVLSMTDLYTKWVIAEPMQSKTAAEVSAIITAKLYLFGMVRKIITDQGKEFVCKLNDSIFNMLKIKHAVASAYHPQTNGQDERTNQNIKRTLRKYVNDNHNDWTSTFLLWCMESTLQNRHSPYFLLFHRHPRLPEVMNACPMGDDFEVADPEDDIDTRVNKMKLLNETVGSSQYRESTEHATKDIPKSKAQVVRVCSIQAGDDVLLSRDPKKRRTGDTFTSQHQGPYTVASISSKGVATIVKGSTCQRVNVSRLRTYYRSKNGPAERTFLQDHCYSTFRWQIEHPYACSGARWEKDLGPIQDELLKYVLDKNRPSEELIIKHGQICLTREDFWSLGLSQCMESNIGNACLKIVEEAAQRHGKNVHIVDLYAIPTWKDKDVDPVHLFSSTAYREFVWHLHVDVCSQHLYLMPVKIHRGGGTIDSPVVVHSADGEVLHRRAWAEICTLDRRSITTPSGNA